MIKLGETVQVNNMGANISQAWLCKQPSLKAYTNEIYIVLGFESGKGWWTMFNGTLKAAREFIEIHR